MQTLSVLIRADKPWHCDAFRAAVRMLQDKVTGAVTIQYDEQMLGQYRVFRFANGATEGYTPKTRNVVCSFIALAAVEWITRIVEPEVLQAVLAKDYGSQLEREWEAVLPHVRHVLQQAGRGCDGSRIRKANLYQQLFDYLRENDALVLEGFVRFRLKTYWNELAEVAAWGVEAYLQEKEYREFVELLRSFITLQEPRHRLVHVFAHEGQRYVLVDEAGEPIRLAQLEMLIANAEQEFRDEDYLVSALVTLAPKHIVLHRFQDKPALVETLCGIFAERIIRCEDCADCDNLSRSNLDIRKPTHYNL